MTPEQVAEYLRINTHTIYRLIRQQKLAASRIGRAYRIPKEDVQAFLLAHSTRPDVRKALFDRVLAIAERDPGVSSDDVLDELEEMDRDDSRSQASERCSGSATVTMVCRPTRDAAALKSQAGGTPGWVPAWSRRSRGRPANRELTARHLVTFSSRAASRACLRSGARIWIRAS